MGLGRPEERARDRAGDLWQMVQSKAKKAPSILRGLCLEDVLAAEESTSHPMGQPGCQTGLVTSGCQSLSRSLWQRKPLRRGVGNRRNPAHTAVSQPARLGRCSAWHGGGGQVTRPRPLLAWAGHVTPWSSAPASVRRDGWTGRSPCRSRRASGLIRAEALACQSQLPG